ncbi:hypothetical protein SAMN05443377_102175 [Propionibacterium cyclohexanicum]|uniref:Integrase catalytic domain-containing protein n=1 Tax=Propionibacterium cyclohexanicum TaxID=64702 RepID=A0A1H9Q7D6_9ACTN|nr:IS30 family transposase [Propionibacterium cyclohexanicum]SER56391.1 hypothetical protein SAMN05443377_102175 [Propionibacterium cyclohexanicum]
MGRPTRWPGYEVLERCTEVERVSRFNTAIPISSTRAEETVAAQVQFFSSLPAHAVRSVAVDKGIEFARHHVLADTLAVPTYLADPDSAWRRGSSEHFNGRERTYLPEGTDFTTISGPELADILAEINDPPRKALDWQTPAEVLEHLCSTTACIPLHVRREPRGPRPSIDSHYSGPHGCQRSLWTRCAVR